jgi:uncharacterized repeat protein (TIGR01451 family)/CSLREA domain-containing protein
MNTYQLSPGAGGSHYLPRYRTLSLAITALLTASPAWSASLTVNTLTDSLTPTPGDHLCTLREAITNASNDTDASNGDCPAGNGADTITFNQDGVILLTDSLSANTVQSLTLDGSGRHVTLSGNHSKRVLNVSPNVTLTLKNITVADGYDLYAAGINNLGNLTIFGSSFTGNSAVSSNSYAGAILNFGRLIVSNSTFSGNSALFGGGIYHTNGSLTLANNTFSGNSATKGGGLYNNMRSINLFNTLFANNSGGDCYSFYTLNPTTTLNNLIMDGSATCNPTLTGDPLLGPLSDNGGSTLSFALLPASPAINAANDALCADPATVNNIDQLGVIRPQGLHCDIGSTELALADLAVTQQDSADPVMLGETLTYTITIKNNGKLAATRVTLTDTLPSNVTFVSTTPSANCSTSGNQINCSLGTLNSGAATTVTVIVKPTVVGALTNAITVAADLLANRSSSEPTTVAMSKPLCNGRTPTIIGTPSNDVINGTSKADIIYGWGGNDVINGGGGGDVICGGEGDDILSGGNGEDKLWGDNGNDSLKGDDDQDMLDGGNGDDILSGGNGGDKLLGNNGNDSLKGDADEDTLDGGAGVNSCDGGKGKDKAVNCNAGVNIP